MRKRKTEKQLDQDKKGRERTRRYEEKQKVEEVRKEETKLTKENDDGIRAQKFYEKIENGEWEEKYKSYKVDENGKFLRWVD